MHICILKFFINFHILLKKNWFSDHEVFFQDDNASCHRTKRIEAFLQERQIKKINDLANSPDLNPIENWFDDDEVLFQDDNATYHRAKGIKAFQKERQIKKNQCHG